MYFKKCFLFKIVAIFLFSLFSGISFAESGDIDPYKYFTFGCDLLETGEYEDSILLTQMAADLFSDFSAYENGEKFYYDCLTQIGEAYLRSGNPKMAQREFQNLFDLAPENMEVLLGIVAVYFRLDKINDGKLFLEAAIKHHKGQAVTLAPLYYNYAMCLSAQNDLKGAKTAAQSSVKNYSKSGKDTPPEVEKFLKQISEKM